MFPSNEIMHTKTVEETVLSAHNISTFTFLFKVSQANFALFYLVFLAQKEFYQHDTLILTYFNDGLLKYQSQTLRELKCTHRNH